MVRPGAAELLRSVGLLADGPVRWGQPVAARGPGIYIVELPAPQPTPALDLETVGNWIERVPGLRLDGERPGSRALMARLASLWLPDATVLYTGSTATSIGGRVAALHHHVLGDPRPHADGHWLLTLRDLATSRIWWAATDAPEEYLDAILEAFASAAPAPALPSGLTRPAGALLLPWATTRRPTGERQTHGLTGAVLPLPDVAPPPPTTVTQLDPGHADGVTAEARGSGTIRRGPSGAVPARPAGTTSRAAAASARAAARPAPVKRIPAAHRGPRDNTAPVELSVEAHTRMTEELDQLTRLRRPEVVARIKAARELGDLRENSEYHAAREEQSFLEGRVQLLEQRLRRAVIVGDGSADGSDGAGGQAGNGGTGGRRAGAGLGSRVTIELNGDETTWTLVGSTEANAAAGRISTASPVGAALIGATAGSEVTVRTPRGDVRYRVLAVE